MYGVQETAGGIFFPLFTAASLNGREDCFNIILNAVDLIAGLVLFFVMEVLKCKIHLLKRDFEDRDGIYLICIIVFICSAVSMTSMTFDKVSNWDAGYVYAVVIPSSLIALGGEILNVCCIIMLERRLVVMMDTKFWLEWQKHFILT